MANRIIWRNSDETLRIVATFNLAGKRTLVVERNEGRDAMGEPGGWSECASLDRDEALEIATALADQIDHISPVVTG